MHCKQQQCHFDLTKQHQQTKDTNRRNKTCTWKHLRVTKVP
jgi:hypothetical protein